VSLVNGSGDGNFASVAVTASIPIGSDPNALALSDDNSALWVGMDGAFSMRRLTLAGAAPVIGPLRVLPGQPIGQASSVVAYAQSLVPLSDSADSVAALVGNTLAGLASLSAFDDGVRRTTSTPFGSSPSYVFKGPPGLFFGTASPTLFLLAVSASGITQTAFPNLVTTAGGGMFYIHYHQGRVYGDTGAVIDVANPAQPVRIGRFPFRGLIAARSSNRMLMLTEGATQGSLQLRILETDNFTQVASLAIGTTFVDILSVSGLVYLGGDGVAFLSPSQGGKSLFIFRSPMIEAVP
jgi:hypothetical protein